MTNEERDRIIYALEYGCDERQSCKSRPFIRGEYIYATTGSVIVRRRLAAEDEPLFADYEAGEDAPSQASVEGLFATHHERKLQRGASASDIWGGLVDCRLKHNDTWIDELNRLEHYTCPCCDNTVYMDGDKIVDEETAERTLLTRYGIKVTTGGKNLIFAGKPVYDAVDCIGRLGKVVDIGVYDTNLFIAGHDFECLVAGRVESPEYDGLKTEIVGTFELN